MKTSSSNNPSPERGRERAQPVRRALAWGLAAAIALPWLIGQAVKTTLQPGIADAAPSATQLVDFIVIGSILWGITMWLVVAIGCWIVAVMKGPRREADSFPVDAPRLPR